MPPVKAVPFWRALATAAGAVTVAALGLGFWRLLEGAQAEAANWVMAAGGMGLVVFSTVQLHRDAQREKDRLSAARAKLKPAAWLARRMCEDALIQSDGESMGDWLLRWHTSDLLYIGKSKAPEHPLSVLQQLMRETVTLAAEAGEPDVTAADTAFDAFIAAANIINDLKARNAEQGREKDYYKELYDAAMSASRKAVQHLATAARALQALAPRGPEEPLVPVNPKFRDER